MTPLPDITEAVYICPCSRCPRTPLFPTHRLACLLLCQELCSKAHPPSIDHDEIDTILRHLLHSAEEQEEAEGEGLWAPTVSLSDPPATLSGVATANAVGHQNGQDAAAASPGSSTGRLEEQGQTSKWTQVFPKEEESTTAGEGSRRSSEGGIFPVPRSPFDGASEAWHPDARSTLPKREGEGNEERDGSLWAWAERGGAPIGRLVSLLSLRVANCGETREDGCCAGTFRP